MSMDVSEGVAILITVSLLVMYDILLLSTRILSSFTKWIFANQIDPLAVQ